MRALFAAPAALSALLIAAHFFRSGLYVLAAVSVALPALLVLRNTWSLRAVQILLLVAAAEWTRTLVSITLERQALGQPWLRPAFILGFVAAFTIFSAYALKFTKRRTNK